MSPRALAEAATLRGGTDRRIVLVGLSGSGKSTVGALLAARLGWAFVDLDSLIEAEAGERISTIFAREGEEGFRAREHAATLAMASRLGENGTPAVLAPGGGWVLDPRNLRALGGSVVSVYLRVSPDLAARRMGEAAEARPLIAGSGTGDQLRELLMRREAVYLQANHTVNVEAMTPLQVSDSIVALASIGSPD